MNTTPSKTPSPGVPPESNADDTASRDAPPQPPPRPLMRSLIAVLLKGVLPLVILAVTILVARLMMDTAPRPPRRPAQRHAKLVEFYEATAATQAITVEAMGTVMPARQVELKPQVSGPLVWLAPRLIPGAYFRQGEPLLRIEPRDYELATTQREQDIGVAEAAVVEARRRLVLAERDLTMEMGSQSVAQREYDLLGDQTSDQNRELILREPQLRAAKAEVEAAQAGVKSAQASLQASHARLEQARLDLKRTHILAPFNAAVMEKLVELGDTVTNGTPLVKLVGTDEFWVELAVAMRDLKWIDAPVEPDRLGSPVRLYDTAAWGRGVYREGRVLMRLPGVDPKGRMARLLVTVKNPLALAQETANTPPLLAGTYVRAEITGGSTENAVVIPRELLRDDDHVWVISPDSTLQIRSVEVLYRGRDRIMITAGLDAGEKIVTTDLSVPVEGMPLRTGAGDPGDGVAVGSSGTTPPAANGGRP